MTRHDPEIEELRDRVHCGVVLEQTPPCWKLDQKESTRAGCFWLESRLGFPNQLRSDSTCWLGGGQQECRSLIRKTCVIA